MSLVLYGLEIENYIYGNAITIRAPVRCATTISIILTSPATTSIDGVTVADGDRVLVKNQGTAIDNGVYRYVGSSTNYTRDDDLLNGDDAKGIVFFVREGTLNKYTAWIQTNTNLTDTDIVVGTDNLTWKRIDLPFDPSGFTDGSIIYWDTTTQSFLSLAPTANNAIIWNSAGDAPTSLAGTDGEVFVWKTSDVPASESNIVVDKIIGSYVNNETILDFISGGTTAPINYVTITNGDNGSAAEIGTGGSTNVNLDILTQGTGVVGIKAGDGSTTGKLLIYDDDSSDAVTVTVPTSLTGWSLTLPPNDGTADYILRTDGSGVTTWVPSTKIAYSVTENRYRTASTSLVSLMVYFPWDDSAYNSYKPGTVIFWGDIELATSLELDVYDGTSSIGSSGTVTPVGAIVTFSITNPIADVLLEFRLRKVAGSGRVSVYGIHLEFELA